jgi:hypothetical protein
MEWIRVTSPRFELEFDESFDSPVLDKGRWISAYLPHWSTWELAASRYTLEDGQLQLLIDEDQPPWCPPLDGKLKVSSLQTALIAGAPGSQNGQHQFDPPATVQNGPHDIRLYTPTYGRFEIRATASADPRLMVAFWMIGLGDVPERSAEILLMEIFGRDVTPDSAGVGMGVRPHQDPAVTDAFERVHLPIDVTRFHDYAAEWTPERVELFVDGQSVKVVEQALAYPMQFMLDVYEFPPEPGTDPNTGPYPKRFTVDYVRGYRYLD